MINTLIVDYNSKISYKHAKFRFMLLVQKLDTHLLGCLSY